MSKKILNIIFYGLAIALIMTRANIVLAQEAPGQSGIVNCGPGHLDAAGREIECNSTAFWNLASSLVKYGIWLGLVMVGLAVAYAGMTYMLSFGSGEKLSQGKGAITAAVTGLLIILTAWLIVNTIITTLLPNCSGQWNVFGTLRCQ